MDKEIVQQMSRQRINKENATNKGTQVEFATVIPTAQNYVNSRRWQYPAGIALI